MCKPRTIITQPSRDIMDTALPSANTTGHFAVPIIPTRAKA